jgi:carbon-monoxide dehydrogenase medium subunit
VEELRFVERRNGSLWIGAGTTQATVESSSEVAEAVPLLARATPFIGHLQIRNRGTVGGSIAHADPAAEYPAVALALDAELDVASPRGRRTIPSSGFFHGTWSTDLADDEVLVGVGFPVWEGRTGSAVEELARRHGDFALAGAAVAVELDDAGTVTRCGIGLLGLGSTPERASGAEAVAVGAAAADVDAAELGHLAMAGLGAVPSDLHASADYRVRIGATLVERAWARALTEAAGG